MSIAFTPCSRTSRLAFVRSSKTDSDAVSSI